MPKIPRESLLIPSLARYFGGICEGSLEKRPNPSKIPLNYLQNTSSMGNSEGFWPFSTNPSKIPRNPLIGRDFGGIFEGDVGKGQNPSKFP